MPAVGGRQNAALGVLSLGVGDALSFCCSNVVSSEAVLSSSFFGLSSSSSLSFGWQQELVLHKCFVHHCKNCCVTGSDDTQLFDLINDCSCQSVQRSLSLTFPWKALSYRSHQFSYPHFCLLRCLWLFFIIFHLRIAGVCLEAIDSANPRSIIEQKKRKSWIVFWDRKSTTNGSDPADLTAQVRLLHNFLRWFLRSKTW